MGQYLGTVAHDNHGSWQSATGRANLHPSLSFPPQILNFFGRQVLGSHHCSRTVIFLESVICDQPALAEIVSHGGAWIGRGVLDVRPIHVTASECEVGLDRLPSVVRIAHNQPSYHVHSVSMQVIDSFQRGIPVVLAVITSRVLGRGTQELQVALQDVFDPEDVPEPSTAHQRSERSPWPAMQRRSWPTASSCLAPP
jgi:hypothetical protein